LFAHLPEARGLPRRVPFGPVKIASFGDRAERGSGYRVSSNRQRCVVEEQLLPFLLNPLTAANLAFAGILRPGNSLTPAPSVDRSPGVRRSHTRALRSEIVLPSRINPPPKWARARVSREPRGKVRPSSCTRGRNPGRRTTDVPPPPARPVVVLADRLDAKHAAPPADCAAFARAPGLPASAPAARLELAAALTDPQLARQLPRPRCGHDCTSPRRCLALRSRIAFQ
jgi:hypothetical protein